METGWKIRLPHTIDHMYQNIGIWENHEYDAAGTKYKSIVYTNLSTTMTPYYNIAHYPFNGYHNYYKCISNGFNGTIRIVK